MEKSRNMKISGLLKKIGSMALIIGTLLGTPKADAADIYLYGSVGLGFNSSQEASIQSVPEYVRDVPIHPQDQANQWMRMDVAPIRDSKINLPIESTKIEGKIGVGIKQDRFNFEIGPKLSVMSIKGKSSKEEERNYTNAPGTDQRGYGAALTFYRFKIDDADIFVPGISVKAAYSIFSPKELDRFLGSEDSGGINLFIEYSADFVRMPFYFETGWDRWNSLEIYRKYEAPIDIVNNTIKGGCEVNLTKNVSIRASLGLILPEIVKNNPIVGLTGFALSQSFYAGLEFNFNLLGKN